MDNKALCTTKEFADYTGIGINKIREMCHIDGFPAIFVGPKKIKIDKVKAVEWLYMHMGQPARKLNRIK